MTFTAALAGLGGSSAPHPSRVLLVAAIVVVTAVLPQSAHAETLPTDTPTWSDDFPALPAEPVPPIEPQVPEGSFDFPDSPEPTASPTVVPITPPPIGDAVATWHYEMSPADREALRQFRLSWTRNSPSGGSDVDAPSTPYSTANGWSDGSEVTAAADAPPVARRTGPILRGGCLEVGRWLMRACV